MRLLVYSHDTFGLGNIRRMMAICNSLRERDPDLTILILTGSPMLHSFRGQQGFDYIKLPCLKRGEDGALGVKFLDLGVESMVALRSQLILATVKSFQPDLLLVDKTPGGLAGELEAGLLHIQQNLPHTKIVLLLRDILDSAAPTMALWKRNNYYAVLRRFYDRILVVGQSDIFDIRDEYELPESEREKVRFCGYIGREKGRTSRAALRAQLGVANDEKLVLLTTGGGEDGYRLIDAFTAAQDEAEWPAGTKSVIVSGPELDGAKKQKLARWAENRPGVQVIEFTDDMMSYLDAADVVVSMGGYNTVCEILTLRKRAIVVPRVTPVEEQGIRAERMARLSLFRCLPPDRLTAKALTREVRSELEAVERAPEPGGRLQLDALPRIAYHLQSLVAQKVIAFRPRIDVPASIGA